MIAKNNDSLGRRIARMRLEHGMTQERLADIANVSAQAVSKWENDQSYPDILLLPVLAKTFGVSVDELLGIETAETPVTQPVIEDKTEPLPVPAVEPEPEPEPEPDPEPAPQPEPEPEPQPEPTPEPEKLDINAPATCVRIHVIRSGKDAVNLTIPLVAARLISNVASYMPERLIDGIDLTSIVKSVQGAGRGTLVNVDDGNDHVIITLE